ncbi:MAG: radical SAM protein [bacterium]|nr:radical SAM protein [bacterium]
MIWEITNRCNYRCPHCIFSSTAKKPKDELSTGEVKKCIKDLKSAGITHLKITGGEPFLREDILELMIFADKVGLKTDISTNASVIDDELASKLKKLNISMIHVGLDGCTPELNEIVRGEKSFERTTKGIKSLVKHGLYTRVGSLIFAQNEEKMENMVKLCIDLGVDEVIFSRLEPVGRLRGNKNLISLRLATDLKNEIEILTKKYKEHIKVSHSFTEKIGEKVDGVCPGGDKFLSIDHKGRVSPCTWVTERAPQYVSGKDLHKYGLDEILKSKEISSYRSLVDRLALANIDYCPMEAIDETKDAQKLDSFFEEHLHETTGRPKFSEYNKIYSFTTENIAGYFPKFDFKEKSVLTVGASGDHLINAYLLGANNVKCFDINLLAQYFTELKVAYLKSHGLNTFKNFLMRDKGEEVLSYNNYNEVKGDISFQARYFFNQAYERFDFNGEKLRESEIFNNIYDEKQRKVSNNLYLENEVIYSKAQKRIKEGCYHWVSSSLKNLGQELDGHETFDLIILSNISDYTHLMFNTDDYLSEFKNLIVSVLLGKLKTGGKIVFAYIYDFDSKNNSKKRNEINDHKRRKEVFGGIEGTRYKEFVFDSAMGKGYRDAIAYLEKVKV